LTNAYRNLDDEDVEWTPRDLLGRPIGIWRQGPVSEGSRPCAKPYQLFGYNSTGFRGSGYDQSGGILDCPVIRWRDTDGNGSLDETVYYLQDFRGDINALAGDAKSGLLERVRYGPTGRPEAFPAADVNFDGIVESDDADSFEAALSAYAAHAYDYDPRADLDRDGDVDSDDESLFLASYDRYSKLSGNWKLSQGDGITPGTSGADAGLDNRFGWRGYWWDGHLQKYHVRNRVYDPREGRWLQTDPIGFAAGDQDLYRYCDGQYSMGYDPLGLLGTYGEAWSSNMDGSTPCDGRQVFGDPNAGNRNDWLDKATNFFAGAADGISFGLAANLRQEWGTDSAVDTRSGWYGAGVGAGVALDFMIVGGAGGMAYMGTFEGAVVSGGLMGMSSDLISQRSQMMAGARNEFSWGEFAASGPLGAAGGAVGFGLGYGVSKYVVAPVVRAANRSGAWLGARMGVGSGIAAEVAEGVGAAEAGACGAAVSEEGGVAAAESVSSDYAETFFKAHPELKGKVVVHHAIEQQAAKKFPGSITQNQLHAIDNLRGIPKELNNKLHLSQIRMEWNRFYAPFRASGTSPTFDQLSLKRLEIDKMFGRYFNPPVE
jgi:RHS repeat-associated protein